MTGEFNKRLAALTFAFTGEGHTKVSVSKSLSEEEGAAIALGEALVPTKRHGGRKPDPNSAFQRITRTLHEVLKGVEEMSKDKLLEKVSKMTGIPVATCAHNAMQVKGIKRSYGVWSLQSG